MGKTSSRWNLRTAFCGSRILMTSDDQFSGSRRKKLQKLKKSANASISIILLGNPIGNISMYSEKTIVFRKN
jgi:hypothetical protein